MGNDSQFEPSTNRRQLLSSAAAITTGSILYSGVAGASTSSGSSESQSGVVETARNLMAEGKYAQAESLLDDNNIDYASSSSTVQAESNDSGGISTQSRQRQDISTLQLYVLDKQGEDDVYTIDAFMHLRGHTEAKHEVSKAGDGFGIVFDHDEWAAVNPDTDVVQAEIVRYEHDDIHDAGPGIEVKDYNPNFGVVAGVYHPSEEFVGHDMVILLSTDLEDTTDPGEDPAPVQAEYIHNGAKSRYDASVGFNVGAAGITVDLKKSVTHWKLDTTTGV